MPEASREIRTRCCIVGGGPAGMMLGLLLARGGVDVTVLEKHGDFLRDFRGDTVHPSTQQVLADIGLIERFDALPQRKVDVLKVQFADGLFAFADFRGLGPFPYVSFVPQWDFLDLLADEGKRLPTFRLLLRAEAKTLLRREGRVVGVYAETSEGPLDIHADLVVGTDGRGSTLRKEAGLVPEELGAPMDVLWFRLSRKPGDPEDTFGVAGRGQIIALINRTEYWQVAFVIPKGSADAIRQQPIDEFRGRLGRLVPWLADRTPELRSFDDLSLLEVRVDRLSRWHLPGLLLIGDAAHAMSPVGGVGINLAIQDAVAAANRLGPLLRGTGPVDESVLAEVQKRRELPTRLMQGIQVRIQRNVITRVLGSEGSPPRMPPWLERVLRFRFVRRIPARVVGYGFRRERVHFGPH